MKYQQPFAAKSEVTFAPCHITLDLLAAHSMVGIATSIHRINITPQARTLEVTSILHGMNSRCWLCMRVSYSPLH